jgi:polar amino acid transport system substrate-binding protein
MLRLLWVFICLLSFNVWALSDKPVVKIVALEMLGYTNSDGSGTYWDMMKAIFSSDYQLNFIAATSAEFDRYIADKSADIYIGTHLERSQGLIVTNQHIDIRYAVYLLHQQNTIDISQLTSLTVAAKRDAYLQRVLKQSTGIYHVDSIENINKLIENKRVDAALSYSYNLSLSDPKKRLKTVKIQPEMKVYTGFNNEGVGQQLAKVFEQRFPVLINDGTIASTFANNAEYSHANLLRHAGSKQISWHIIPKKFDPQTKKLSPVASEVFMAQGIDSLIPNIDFNIKFNSMRQLKDELINNENTCVHNIMKNTERESYAYFSKPSYVFLPPRIIMKNDRAKQLDFNDFSVNGEVDMKQLFIQYPELRVSVVRDSNTDKVLREHVSQEVVERLYYSKDNSLNNTFSLFLSDRVDAVITWPSLISSVLDDRETSETLTSYQISNVEETGITTYIACSKSKVGMEMIDQINHIFSDAKNRDTLFAPEYLKMDANSKEAFRTLLRTYYQ